MPRSVLRKIFFEKKEYFPVCRRVKGKQCNLGGIIDDSWHYRYRFQYRKDGYL